MSMQSIVRSLVIAVVCSVSGAALAAPPVPAMPLPKQVALVRVCQDSRPAPGYRDIFARFGVGSDLRSRPVAGR
jgi:hypothetical protein